MLTSRSAVLLVLLVSGVASAVTAQEIQPVRHVIDTHIHLYDTNRDVEITWPPESDEVLYRPHMPEEYSRVAKAAGVTGVVVVEASLNLDDNRWVLDLVDGDEFYVGLVGNVDVTRKDFQKQIRRLRADSRFVGVRTRGRGPIDYADPVVLKNLHALAAEELTMDYLTNGGGIQGIRTIDKVASEIPELTIVVNHCLGYNFDGKAPKADWIQAVADLAENKNVYCKISGLYQRSVQQPASQDPDYYADVLQVLWDKFGEDRLIYGSNWPVTRKTDDYASFLKLADSLVSRHGQQAREKYYWQNAARAYRLPLK